MLQGIDVCIRHRRTKDHRTVRLSVLVHMLSNVPECSRFSHFFPYFGLHAVFVTAANVTVGSSLLNSPIIDDAIDDDDDEEYMLLLHSQRRPLR